MIDIVTVHHNEVNRQQAQDLLDDIVKFEGEPDNWSFVDHSNEVDNIGFAKACNAGAALGSNPYIGFINPDCLVKGPFFQEVIEAFEDPLVVIAGNRYGKPQAELEIWGCKEWVCGATFFVSRHWFELIGGFDTGYEWAWEETDLIRTAESQGFLVKALDLPITHSSPSADSRADARYKRLHFEEGRKRFVEKWS